MPITLSGKVVYEYCLKYPNVATMTLAKKIYSENNNKTLFNSLETVRSIIRDYRGANGNLTRKNMKTRVPYNKEEALKPFLPISRTVKQETFKLPTSIKKVLLLSDIHIPYHDEQAVEAAIQDGINENVDCVFLNGDVTDFYQVSFHEKDPRKRSLSGELEDCRGFLAYLRSRFPMATIYFIPGNHEIRLERYLRVKAPELLDMEEFRLDILLKMRENDIIYLGHGTKVYFGKLLVEHGDKLRGAGGVNPARTLALKLKRHVICGHFHRPNEVLSKVYDGDVFVTYSTGCLCDLEPEYLRINEHAHGHAIIEMDGDEFRVKNKKIVNGKVF